MFQTWVDSMFNRQTQSCPTRGAEMMVEDIISRPRSNTSGDEYEQKSIKRVSDWDSKREMCKNCKHIFLKFLSSCNGFCSLDCKSNSIYLHAVSDSIRAAQDALKPDDAATNQQETNIQPSCDQICQLPTYESPTPSIPMPSKSPNDSSSSGYTVDEYDDEYDEEIMERHTYSDFHTEKLRMARPVEWNFSALY